MLSRMTPGQFEEWCAKDEVEPIGYSSQMLGLIAFQLATYMSGEQAGDVKAEHYMPWTKYEPEKSERADNEAAGQYVRSIFGN